MNQTKEIVVEYMVDNQQIKLTPSIVQQFIVRSDAKITLPEFKFFTEICKVRGLNPFLNEAYLIKYGEQPAQIVVSKDVILKRAVLHPQYDGKESGLILLNENEDTEERVGGFWNPEKEKLLGSWCRVYRKDWSHPEYVSVPLNEVAQKKKDGTFNSNWFNKTATMLIKVATTRALRETFVEEFAGMYIEDEFNQDKEIKQEEIKEDSLDNNEKVVDIEINKEVNINEL